MRAEQGNTVGYGKGRAGATAEMTAGSNLTDAIFAVAAREPHSVAVIEGDRQISYASLCRAVRVAAARFAQAGWRAGDVVGISISGEQVYHVIAALALARSGMAQVMLPPSDPLQMLQARIQRLGIKAAVSDCWQAGELGIDVVGPERGWLDTVSGPDDAVDLRVSGGDRLWLIAETSGTTALPKASGATHDVEIARNARQASLFSHRPGERFATLTGLSFSIATRRAIDCLNDGATLVIVPPSMTAASMLKWINDRQIRYVSCVPLHLHFLLREARSESPALPSLRILRVSTAALDGSVVDQVRTRISPNLHVGYGFSEAGSVTAATPEMLAAANQTVGRPLPGIELEIVDEADQPVPRNTVGRIRVRGPGTGLPYLDDRPAGGESVFRNGWCYPGDVGFIDERGLLFLKGRADEMMSFDGMLVGPAEIESVLQQHPAVVDVAAFALPSAEHQDVPAAAIVASRPLSGDELSRFCRERLGKHAPRLFLQLDAIPRSPMGKIVRRRLTELALAELERKARPRN